MASARSCCRLTFLACWVFGLGCASSGETPSGSDAADNGVAPTVVSTTPDDDDTAVAPNTTITVLFSEAMNPATIATNTDDSTCSGSVQLSSDDFDTCVQMSADPSTEDNTSFEVTPAAPLSSATSYRIRVAETAEDASGAPLGSIFETASGFTARYYHSMPVDDQNDFDNSGESFTTSTTGARLFVSHDADSLYIGLSHPDIVVGGAGNKFAYFLFSTDTTMATGNARSSDGKAKFGAAGTKSLSYHWKERIDGSNYSEFRVGTATDWDTDWTAAGKAVHRSAGHLEASIALSELGGDPPTTLIITAYTVDYSGDGGNGYLYNMLDGATDGSGIEPRDLVGYVELTLPTSLPPNDPSHLKTF